LDTIIISSLSDGQSAESIQRFLESLADQIPVLLEGVGDNLGEWANLRIF